MKTSARHLLALLVLAVAGSGCGASAELLKPADLRAPLERGFYTTYTLAYRVRRHGLIGPLLGGPRVEDPRLLYTDGDADYDRDPGAFRDTGAPFDAEHRTVSWRIPNVRDLRGKRLRFVVDGANLTRHPVLALDFPGPGKILAVEPLEQDGRVRFVVTHQGDVYGLRFTAAVSRDRKIPMTVEEIESPSAGVRIFAWDATRDLSPDESRFPVLVHVEYEDWYYQACERPVESPAVRVPRTAVFGAPEYDEKGGVRLPLKVFGSEGALDLEVQRGEDWVPAAHAALEGDDEERVVSWDLEAEGLTPLSTTVRLRARSLQRTLGVVEIPPPKPSLKILSFRQEGGVVVLLFEARFVAHDAVGVFAGSGRQQRRLGDDEIVQRKDGLLAFRIDGLETSKGPGGESLTLFLSARNDAGQAGTEIEIPLVGIRLVSLRQTDGVVEIRAEPPRDAGPLTLLHRPAGDEDWREAGDAAVEGGKVRWPFLAAYQGRPPEELELRLVAARGTSSGELRTRFAPLAALAGEPVHEGNGIFGIPLEIRGKPEWVRFEFAMGDQDLQDARAARFDAASGRIRWPLWDDVPKHRYQGQDVTLRATFRNASGFLTVTVPGLAPPFLRLGTPVLEGASVRVPVRTREDMRVSFFVSTDWGQSFRPLAGARFEKGVLVFDVTALGPIAGKALKLRAAASDARGRREEDEIAVRLPAGIDPERAYWHQGMLWIRYEVDWSISEKDVRAEFSVTSPAARPPEWLEASVTSWRVFDVNWRGFEWDVARDMVRGGTTDPERLHLRLVIQDRGAGQIVRQLSLADFPPPPIAVPAPALKVVKGCLAFSLGAPVLPPGAPAYSERSYNTFLEYLDPETGQFTRARIQRRFSTADTLAWARDQAEGPVTRGTWARIVVTSKSDNRVTGFALVDLHLDKDHAFFTGEEGF